ncbi:MAG TPA: tRNA (N6-isopentenyl adenosine(37)-C2)-methylthiotransferase MiaB [Chloroflexota bacterium]|jgi:tRNA-2-methylthio-N6-dimethylallyladenosine synthase|nr:tRNA (N6-isopentenyl adenosine(37)-C2)-methylthiotransferase MiaB [Chloroflexota bacterium]
MSAFHIWTIGCQMNVADSRRLAESLQRYGLETAEGPHAADVVVLYSCVVRQQAEDRVHGQLHALQQMKAARPEMKVIVAGCVSDVPDWRKRYPFVDLIAEPGQDLTVRERLIDLLDLSERYRFDPEQAVRIPGVSEGVTIHQGCNRSCTYCIVPQTRGSERSRPPEVIVDEVEKLVERGTKEVVLLSQIVERYGRDLRPRVLLSELLRRLNDVAGLERIRFLTSYPGDFGNDLVAAVADLPKVCEEVNLPIQAGDDDVLRRMRRGYVVDHYRELIGRLRQRMPEIGLSTDIIVGFPGETETQFQHTLDMLVELRFDVVHVAMYSPRPGTVAATEMEDDVPRPEKRRRLHEVERVQKRVAADINQRYLGRTVEVLVEGTAKGRWYGRTRTNKLCHFSSEQAVAGRLVQVDITRTEPWYLEGELQGGMFIAKPLLVVA